MHLTYRYRVKDKHALALNRMARSANIVWNYCNDVQRHAVKWGRKWPTAFDFMALTSGTCKELGISSKAINAVCRRYEKSRRQFRRPWLRYRGKKSLGWVPMRADDVCPLGGGFRCMGKKFSVWKSRELPVGGVIRDGSTFSQDATGRWYLNLVVKIPDVPVRECQTSVGIDLGLKTLAALSNGEKVQAPRWFRDSEAALVTVQKARKTARARRIHMKVANRRRDFLHKLSARLVREFDFIAVGDVSPSQLAKTRMAKSVLDAGWSSLRQMIAYKSIANGARYLEVDERYSTRACSDCGSIGGPKGRKGLVIRHWICGDCGAVHDRDINSARFILRRGLATLSEEPVRITAQEKPIGLGVGED